MRIGPDVLDRRTALAGSAAAMAALAAGRASAQGPAFDALQAAVIGVRTEVPADARTAETLGRSRLGSATLIDEQGLAITVGWLVMEASTIELLDHSGKIVPAEIVGWDAESGLGLIRATAPIAGSPIRLGSARGLEKGSPVLTLSRAGALRAQPQMLVSRRQFAGYWEYLLEDALFTAPAFDGFAGAPLVDEDGRLVGIGLLSVGDAVRPGLATPGNMFVPVDAVTSALGDLLATGRRQGPGRSWLGVTAVEDGGVVRIVRIAPASPAADAGLAEGDVIRRVNGVEIGDLAACWKALWAAGPAGTVVPIEVMRASGPASLSATTVDRAAWLRLRPTL